MIKKEFLSYLELKKERILFFLKEQGTKRISFYKELAKH